MTVPMIHPGLYTHFKGGKYRLISVGRHSETNEKVIIYQSFATGEVWVRPLESWTSTVVWPDGVTRQRFCLSKELECKSPTT